MQCVVREAIRHDAPIFAVRILAATSQRDKLALQTGRNRSDFRNKYTLVFGVHKRFPKCIQVVCTGAPMSRVVLVFSLALIGCLYSQAPATDPHEDPRANGGNHPGDTNPAPKNPDAVPDPVPIRAPNPDTPEPKKPSPGKKPVTDAEIMHSIRASLSKDPSTAPFARQVKVISHAGTVTLKGTVPTAEIRHSVEQKAAAVAGEEKVTNQIDVKTRSSDKSVRKGRDAEKR